MIAKHCSRSIVEFLPPNFSFLPAFLDEIRYMMNNKKKKKKTCLFIARIERIANRKFSTIKFCFFLWRRPYIPLAISFSFNLRERGKRKTGEGQKKEKKKGKMCDSLLLSLPKRRHRKSIIVLRPGSRTFPSFRTFPPLFQERKRKRNGLFRYLAAAQSGTFQPNVLLHGGLALPSDPLMRRLSIETTRFSRPTMCHSNGTIIPFFPVPSWPNPIRARPF